jgi:hypothetical protein
MERTTVVLEVVPFNYVLIARGMNRMSVVILVSPLSPFFINRSDDMELMIANTDMSVCGFALAPRPSSSSSSSTSPSGSASAAAGNNQNGSSTLTGGKLAGTIVGSVLGGLLVCLSLLFCLLPTLSPSTLTSLYYHHFTQRPLGPR